MAVKFILIDRDTPHLFLPSIQDYLPDDHLARFVVYRAMQRQFDRFLGRHGASKEASAIVEVDQREIPLYEKYRHYYSDGVYVVNRPMA